MDLTTPTEKENLVVQTPADRENLVVFRQKPNADWIEFLENALERAKTGEVTGGAIIESRNDAIRTTQAGLKNRFEFIGLMQNAIKIILE
jgi:hypothetical protein